MKTWMLPGMKRTSLLALLFLAAASGGCRQGPWTLWNAYAAHFIDDDGRVVDHQAGDHSTSEGQSYALFFALSDNDRGRFDKVLNWTENNLAGGNMGTHLPGWLWGKGPDGQWKLLDTNPASDADCWFAYTLVEAGRLWKSPAYYALGQQMMALIAKQEVADLSGFGSMLMPGTTALWVHNNTWTLNPSYVPLFLFERFAQVDPAGPWGAIAMNIPRLLRQSARRGFAMDWVDYMPGDGFYPAAPPATEAEKSSGEAAASAGKEKAAGAAAKPAPAGQAANAAAGSAGPKPPVGSYDAIRVYLWAGMVAGEGRTRADMLGSLSGMAAYIAGHGAPPEKVNAQGVPQEPDGPVGFSAAVLPYLWALPDLARAAAQLRVRIGAQLNPETGLYGKNPVYYDQSLALFATGYLDGRFRFGPRGELKLEWTR
ncbi:MAG TPA: endoglucanase [Terracidiphilus sp.]|jgi:endoglucanase|nr:endoglucanase [Terracidiphilus sp.]